jgi:esterase FrsA
MTRDKWAAAFSEVAKPYEEKAAQAEQSGDPKNAKENYLRAYQYYEIARYPTTNSAGKKEAYRKSQEMLFKASRYFDIQ